MNNDSLMREVWVKHHQRLLAGDAREITDMIYDTLVSHKEYPQFNFYETLDFECDSEKKQITFAYCGHRYVVTVENQEVEE